MLVRLCCGGRLEEGGLPRLVDQREEDALGGRAVFASVDGVDENLGRDWVALWEAGTPLAL